MKIVQHPLIGFRFGAGGRMPAHITLNLVQFHWAAVLTYMCAILCEDGMYMPVVRLHCVEQ